MRFKKPQQTARQSAKSPDVFEALGNNREWRAIHLRFFLSIHHNNRKIATGNPTQNKIA